MSRRVPREVRVVIGDEIAEAHWYPKDALPEWPADSPAAVAVSEYLSG